MSSKQVQLLSLSPAEIKKLSSGQVPALLLTVNFNTLSYRQLQAFVMYLRINKWTRKDFKANQKKDILLAEIKRQVAAARRKSNSTKTKSKPKRKTVSSQVNRVIPDKKYEIAKVEKITGYIARIINSSKYNQEVIRFDTTRKVEQSDYSEPIYQPATAITVYYVEGKGWRDAISPRKSPVTYYDTLEKLVTSCGDYRNKIKDSVEGYQNKINKKIDYINHFEYLYSIS